MCSHWLSLGLTAWLRDSHILRQLPSANSGNSIASGAKFEIQEVSESVELGLLAYDSSFAPDLFRRRNLALGSRWKGGRRAEAGGLHRIRWGWATQAQNILGPHLVLNLKLAIFSLRSHLSVASMTRYLSDSGMLRPVLLAAL